MRATLWEAGTLPRDEGRGTRDEGRGTRDEGDTPTAAWVEDTEEVLLVRNPSSAIKMIKEIHEHDSAPGVR